MTKKHITQKQDILLQLIYTFRFLHSKQLQQLLSHKDHRRINSWLKDLTEKQLLERDFRPRYGLLTKPALYNLSPQGRSYLRRSYPLVSTRYVTRLRDDAKRSKAYRIRCQLVADFYLALFARTQQSVTNGVTERLRLASLPRDTQFHFLTPAYFDTTPCVLLTPLNPDAYWYRELEKETIQSMLFVIDSYVPRLMLSTFLKRLFDTLSEESWEEQMDSLHVYILCP
jgi:hypothetical protein